MNLIFILSLYSQMDDEENMAILLDFVVIKNMTEAATVSVVATSEPTESVTFVDECGKIVTIVLYE